MGTEWDASRLEKGRALWDTGMPVRAMGLELGCSYSAVASVAKRYGWPMRRLAPGETDAARPMTARPSRAKLKAPPPPAPPPVPAAPIAAPTPPPPPPPAPPPPPPPPRPVVPAIVRRCVWPMWDNRERPTGVYCDVAPVVPGRPYCDAHCAVAYTERRGHALPGGDDKAA